MTEPLHTQTATDNCYLVAYRPLIHTKQGRMAAEAGRPSYADYSCRSEPSLEHPRPAITALCRADKFAPRLRPGDLIAYATIKGKWQGLPESHWRLTAVLRVCERFERHEDAAAWYRSNGYGVPTNLVVPGSNPLPLEQTSGFPNQQKLNRVSEERRYALWVREYARRAAKHPVALVTEPLFIQLHDPPIVTPATLQATIGFSGLHQNPPAIPPERFAKLLCELSPHSQN